MKYTNNLLVILIILLLCSCSNMNPTITVVYLTGTFETSVAIKCETLKKRYANVDEDTVVYITENEFDEIVELMKIPCTQKMRCDTRMYVQYDSLELCFSVFDSVCCIDSDNITDKQKWTAYQMKCKSGYYNYISPDNLEFYEYIEKFGIPKNYKYHLDGLDKKESMKRYLNTKNYVKVLFKVGKL